MEQSNKNNEVWTMIIKLLITILTSIATTLTTTSCI